MVYYQGFVLEGFEGGLETQALLFAVFLTLYMVTVLGNLAMIVVINLDARLHSPMYFFLKNLSFLDLCYSSVIAPNALANFFSPSKVITFAGCATQLFFFSLLVTTEGFLLGVMAYDRFMAICSPLHYPITMTPGICVQLVAFSFACGFSISVVKVYFISSATFCGSNVLNHFFCDISPILKLACTDFSTAELVDFVLAFIILVFPLVATVLSYGHITLAVLRIPSATGRLRAFSTCASHLAVVTIFYMAMIFMYVRPQAIDSRSSNKFISAVYTVLTPIINPLIYCLRNKEFKAALKKALR
ncbi:olfactory receptor 6B2-like [Suricata suricatta]|uniref:olfactory receptor 6B2-like n=1 Tax=Suricata suricatta TaxID=37032 RepID=UPI0011558D8B|nr:olfactory receptor 6B2-like [Suricata suricatta]